MLLKGVKVVEFASYIAGPGACCILGDWGAEVIKVERPGGDAMRHAFSDVKVDLGGNPTFDLDNRGKRGIVLDIAKPEGREALAKLAQSADVFLTNVRPASMKRAGLDEATLRAANPRLIYAQITGYGLEGPEAHKPGFDVTAFWARAGVANMTAPKGMDPFMLRSGFGDHITALATVSAILAALYEREQTGVGRLVQTSLLATGIYTVGSDLAVQLTYGRLASNRTRDNPINPIGNFYKTGDGKWFVHNPRRGQRDWEMICQIAGRPELVTDERFATGMARRQHARELTIELDQGFERMTFAELAAQLDEHDMVWAPVQTPADVVADPQAAAAGAFLEVENDKGGTFRSPAAPARFPGADATRRPRSPHLGEHTRDVLTELGYGPTEIEALFEAGAAG